MAIYHLSIKTIARAAGRSATAAAAYRSGEKISDLASGQVFDYTRKRGVEHTEIVLPTAITLQDSPWARDRQALWNAAEAAEKRRDARVAREYELAIPCELNKRQGIDLVRDFSTYLANRYGVGADIAIHAAHREGDQRNRHAHVLTTTREVTSTGLGAKIALELSETDRAKRGLPHSREEFVEVREQWSTLSNEHLRRSGQEARIDHRTLAAQGIDRRPSVHLGVAVMALMRRGIESRVENRVAWQERQAVLQRLEAAKTAGALEREGRPSDAGLVHRSTDVPAARRQRDTNEAIDRAQARSREEWLEYRKKQTPQQASDKLISGTLLVLSRETPVTERAQKKVAIEWNRGGEGMGR